MIMSVEKSKKLKQKYGQYIGVKGEEETAKLLSDQGFVILERNYCTHNVGEIDIIAEREGDIYVFEVRTRLNLGSYPDSSESVTAAKRRRIMRTATYYIDENDLYDRNVVFKVAKVTHDEQGNIVSIEFVPF